VVFDLDDTLWNTLDTLHAAHEAMVVALGELCPDMQIGSRESFADEMKATMAQHPDRSHDFTFIRLEMLQRLTGSQDVALKAFDAWFARRNAPTLFEGALEALRALREAGLKVGTLTDGSSDPTRMDGLREIVDFAVSSEEAGAAKPDRRMFELCEEKSGCKPAELVMVGDNAKKDVAGAKAAGWRAIWVRPPQNAIVNSSFDLGGGGGGDGGELGADATVDHVAEIQGVLRKWATAPSSVAASMAKH